MVFSLDPGAFHRPLGVTFRPLGVTSGAGGSATSPEPLPLGWIGVATPASVALLLPPPDHCGAAGRFTRAQLKRSGGSASGLLLARTPASSGEVGALAEDAAHAANVPLGQVLVVARPDDVTVNGSARASARGIIDGMRVSLLGLAAGRPLPRREQPLVALLLTDAALRPAVLERLLNEVAGRSFGSVAGLRTPGPDDALLALATGAVGSDPLEPDSLGYRTLKVGAIAVAQSLVRQLLERSAPGAIVVQLTIQGAASDDDAARTAETLAAALGDDPDLRRALRTPDGSAGLAHRLAPLLARAGVESATLRCGVAQKRGLIAWRVDLGAGAATATRWTAISCP